jgi:hypothetical protein
LQGKPGVDQTVAFGTALHVTGKDAQQLEQTLKQAGTADQHVTETQTSLEDVFIHMMGGAQDNMAAAARARPRSARRGHEHCAQTQPYASLVLGATLVEHRAEGVPAAAARPRHVRHDRRLPIVQLLLFGFAINSDPRHMPTAVIVAEHSDFSRTFIAALENTTYFKVVRTMPDEAAGREALLRGDVQFVVSIPADFSRRCCMATGQRSWSRPTPPIPPRRARHRRAGATAGHRGPDRPEGRAGAAGRRASPPSTSTCSASTTRRASRSTTSCRG